MMQNPRDKGWRCTKGRLISDMERFLNNLYLRCQHLNTCRTNIDWVGHIWEVEKKNQPPWVLELMNYIESFYKDKTIQEYIGEADWMQFYGN